MKTKKQTKKNKKTSKGKAKKLTPAQIMQAAKERAAKLAAKYEALWTRLMMGELDLTFGKVSAKDGATNDAKGKASDKAYRAKVSADMVKALAILEDTANAESKLIEDATIAANRDNARLTISIEQCATNIRAAIEEGESVFPRIGENRFYLHQLLSGDDADKSAHARKYGKVSDYVKTQGIDGKTYENAAELQKLFLHTTKAKAWLGESSRTATLQYAEDDGNCNVYYMAFRRPSSEAFNKAVSYLARQDKLPNVKGEMDAKDRASRRVIECLLDGDNGKDARAWAGKIKAKWPNAFKVSEPTVSAGGILSSIRTLLEKLGKVEVSSASAFSDFVEVKKAAIAISNLASKLEERVKEAKLEAKAQAKADKATKRAA